MAARRKKAAESSAGSNSGAVLRALVERIERLDAELDALRSDIKDIYAEAKATGFDVTVLRKVIARRKAERTAIEELDQMIATYESALDGAKPEISVSGFNSDPFSEDE